MPGLLELLEARQPALAFLQETKAEPEAFPHDELGYQAVHHSAGRGARSRCEAAAGRTARLADEPFVVAGDFNICPSDLDVYDPVAFVGSTHVTPAERERFARCSPPARGDAYRELHPSDQSRDSPAWWDYHQGHFHRKMGLRIDAFLLLSPWRRGWSRAASTAPVARGPKPSDHAPLLAELGN